MKPAPDMPGAHCPHCGEGADCASGVSDPNAFPDDGSILVCLYCSGIGVFEKGQIRKPDLYEGLELNKDPSVIQARAVIDYVNSVRPS